MADVLCFGNLQLDVLCRPVDDLPPSGELRQVDHVDLALSGNGGNVAAALGRLGVSVELAGFSGADGVGESFRTALAEQGVGLRALARHPSAGTGTSVITVSSSGERTVLFVNGANALFDLADVPDAWLDAVKVVSVGSVFVLPQFTPRTIAALFRRARERDAATVLNICPVTGRADLAALSETLGETDYFVLNRDEGRRLAGTDRPEPILAALAPRTRGEVLLTLGAAGCCYTGRDGVAYVPAEPVDEVDSTGAGDGFVAGLIAGIVSGRPQPEAAALGCRVAAYAVTGPGAYPRIPALADLLRAPPPR